MLSWRSDRHHGQWLVLHVPFVRIQNFLDAEVLAKVPKAHRYLALAVSCTHPVARRTWFHEERLRDEMRREGRSRKFKDDVLAQLTADTHLIRKYLAGTITMSAETRAADVNLAPATYFAIQPEYERLIQEKTKTLKVASSVGQQPKSKSETCCC